MPLPVIQYRSSPTPGDLLRLFLQTEAHWVGHIAEPHPLESGTAYQNPSLPRVYDANQVLDAALPAGLSAGEAIDHVERSYADRGLRCAGWTINPSAPEEAVRPLVEALSARGYRPIEADVLLLRHWDKQVTPLPESLRIIPARASYRHTRALAEESAARYKEPQLADAGVMHLDDPRWELFLALEGDRAVARAGVLSVGEVGRIDYVFVSRDRRGRGIGRLIMQRVLDLCARAMFRHVMLSTFPDNEPAQRLYQRLGFVKIGRIARWMPADLPISTRDEDAIES